MRNIVILLALGCVISLKLTGQECEFPGFDVKLGKLPIGEKTYLTRPTPSCFGYIWVDFYIEDPIDYNGNGGSSKVLIETDGYQSVCGNSVYVTCDLISSSVKQDGFTESEYWSVNGELHIHDWWNISLSGGTEFYVNLNRSYSDYVPWLDRYFKDKFEAGGIIRYVRLLSCDVIFKPELNNI